MESDLRSIGRAYYASPDSSFRFGPYSVEAFASVRPASRHARSQFTLVGADGGRVSSCLEFVGPPPGFKLMAGISGDVNGQPFEVTRVGPRLRRRSRVITVSGAVRLRVRSSHRRVLISRESTDEEVWRSQGNVGILSALASPDEAAVVCALVANFIPGSTSLMRVFNCHPGFR